MKLNSDIKIEISIIRSAVLPWNEALKIFDILFTTCGSLFYPIKFNYEKIN